MAFRSLIRAGQTSLKEKLMMRNSRILQNPSGSDAICRRIGTTTVPKQRAYSPSAAEQMSRESNKQQGKEAGRSSHKGRDYVPVYISVGIIALAVVFGVHTIKQELMHNPAVNLKKNRRETVTEVEEPERAANEADKYVNNSFFRKVAHVQEFDTPVPDNIRGDALARKPRVETLKSVGVDPKTKAET